MDEKTVLVKLTPADAGKTNRRAELFQDLVKYVFPETPIETLLKNEEYAVFVILEHFYLSGIVNPEMYELIETAQGISLRPK